MDNDNQEDPSVGVSVTLDLTMGVIQNGSETLEGAVRRELDQNLTGIRATNLLDSANIKDVEQLQRSGLEPSPEPESGDEK